MNLLMDKIDVDEPIFEEFFIEKQSDHYDMILDFTSFNQLKQKGWTANFTPEGYEKYLNCKDKNTNVIGIIGNKSRGKSFFLGRIIEEESYVPPSGFLVTTHGISCNFPKIYKENDENDKKRLKRIKGDLPIITLDTAGKDNPLLQNAFNKEYDIETISKDQKVSEIVLSDFILQKANILVAVIEQLNFAEQEMLKTLIDRLKQKEVEEHEKRRLIVIHNLMNISTIEGIEDFKNNILFKSLTFELEEQFMGANNDEKYNDSEKKFYIQKNIEKNAKLEIYHFIIGDDLNDTIKKEYNDPALRYIRDLIITEPQKHFDILQEFTEFIIANSMKYLCGDRFSGFSKDQLIIGQKQKKKVYIDKEKKKTADKIIIPIILKNKSIPFETKKFKYDGENYTFLSNIEPRYSAKIYKKSESEKYLQIIFEMFGKVTILNHMIDYDDENSYIIILIKGETKEGRVSPKTIIKLNNNELKYTDFEFQVKIKKIIPYKNKEEYEPKKCYTIDIQDEEKYIFNKNEKIGKYELLFPIKLYEINI